MTTEYRTLPRFFSRWFYSFAFIITSIIIITFTWNNAEAQTAPQVTSALPNYAIFGNSRVTIQKSSVVSSGYIGTYTDGLITDVVTINAASPVFARNLEVRGTTIVPTAYFTVLNNANNVTNEYPFPTTPLLTLPAIPTVTPGTQNITVSATTQNLAAGNYNTLVVQGSKTVVFTGGVYNFNSITLNSGSNLRFTAATEIRVASRFITSSRSTITPQGTGLTGANLRITVLGANVSDTDSLPAVNFGSSNTINANIYAPNGLIDVGGSTQVTGSLIGNWIYLGTSNRVTLASAYSTTLAVAPTATVVPPTATLIPPTATTIPPTATTIPPTATTIPPTATIVPPTVTPTVIPSTATTVPPTATVIAPTVIPATATTVPPTSTPVTTTGTYYVSRNGNNSDGRSWATAWNELNQINWSVIQSGNVIYIDGGTANMTYTTELRYGKSGVEGNPIRIQRSTEAGRNGQVIFFGGRTQTLPYCGQPTYDDSASTGYRDQAIHTNNQQWVTIDGTGWRGIFIHGFKRTGIRIERSSTNLTFRNVEIYNNGAVQAASSGGWRSDNPGVMLAGVNTTFQRAIIHDNGADAFQSLFDQNNINNFRLEQSWLYNSRMHPTSGESWNYCTHTDGIQLYDGGIISGITITETIIGPGFTQGVMLGQTMTSNGDWAEVDNVTMRDVLFAKAEDNNIMGYRGTDTDNWNLDRVTAYCPTTNTHCLHLQNSNHSITNSIFVDGLITFPDGLPSFSGNCQYLTGGATIGTITDPLFASVSATDVLSNDDYRVNNPACVGSRITSVSQLLSLP